MSPAVPKEIAKTRCFERVVPLETDGRAGNGLKEAFPVRSKGQGQDSGQQALLDGMKVDLIVPVSAEEKRSS